MGLLVLLKTLVEIGLAFGVAKALSRFIFLANGGIGRAFELVTAVWTCSHESGHIWEEISPHLSRDEVGLAPACHQATMHLTLSRHSA